MKNLSNDNVMNFNIVNLRKLVETEDSIEGILELYLEVDKFKNNIEIKPVRRRLFNKLIDTCKKISVSNSTVFDIGTKLFLRSKYIESKKIFKMIDQSFLYQDCILDFVYKIFSKEGCVFRLKELLKERFSSRNRELFDRYRLQFDKIKDAKEHCDTLYLLLKDQLNWRDKAAPEVIEIFPESIIKIYSTEKQKRLRKGDFKLIDLIGDLVQIVSVMNDPPKVELLIDQFYAAEYKDLLYNEFFDKAIL